MFTSCTALTIMIRTYIAALVGAVNVAASMMLLAGMLGFGALVGIILASAVALVLLWNCCPCIITEGIA